MEDIPYVRPMTTSTAPIFSPLTFLERVYGVLFLPGETFAHLRSQPATLEAALTIILIRGLESLRSGQGAVGTLLGMVLALVGWSLLCRVLWSLGAIYGRVVSYGALLTLTGYASLPWLCLAPALSLPSPWGRLAAIAVMLWFGIWQLWATSVALEISGLRLLWLIPLAAVGGFLSVTWLAVLIGLVFSF
jgi:hypothetical protein